MKLLALALIGALVSLQAAAQQTSGNKSTSPAQHSVSTSSNPLIPNALFPQWDKISAKDVGPATKQVLEEEGAALDLLEADLRAAGKDVTYERIFRPNAQIRYRLDTTYGLSDNLQSVVDSPELRKAIEAVQPDRVAFELRFSQSKAIYDAVMDVRNTPAKWDKLNAEQQRIVNITIKEFKTSGVRLEPQQLKQYNTVIDRLAKLTTNFTNNVMDSQAAFKLLITDKKQLDGMQQSALEVAAKRAVGAGHKNATTESGPWLLTLDYPTYLAVVTFAHDRELRKKLYTSYRRVAADGVTNNDDVIKQILKGRQELAQLLNFTSYAEQAFLGKMATFQHANELMAEVKAAARPVSIAEDRALTAFARNVTGNRKLKLLWWDMAYWAERQKEAKFKVKDEELRQYLPLPSVKEGLWKLANRLYGVTVKLSQQQLPVWHPDVEVYELYDTNSTTPMAFFYADLYARPGTKQSGAWVQPISDRAPYRREASPAARAAAELRSKGQNISQLYSQDLAKQQAEWLAAAPLHLPVAVLVSNQNPPTNGKPSLMSMDDAETLFHEFGHALQAMLTRVKEPLAAGMRNIEWDAVEAPSQMQEKWVYDKNTFDSFAKHWETGKPVPKEMFDAVKASRTYRKGNYFTYQLMLASTDLRLHSTFDPTGNMTASQVQHEQYATMMPFPPSPEDRQINSFSHIFAGGYPAGYYSYLWADVMSADGFMAFEEAGTGNEAEVQRLGRKFRDTFLSLGGSVPPAEVFRQFRGRDPKVENVIKFNNLGKGL